MSPDIGRQGNQNQTHRQLTALLHQRKTCPASSFNKRPQVLNLTLIRVEIYKGIPEILVPLKMSCSLSLLCMLTTRAKKFKIKVYILFTLYSTTVKSALGQVVVTTGACPDSRRKRISTPRSMGYNLLTLHSIRTPPFPPPPPLNSPIGCESQRVSSRSI